MDPALSYGLVEYLRTLDMLTDYGWSWRALYSARRSSVRLAYRRRSGAFGNESYPHVFQPFGGFGDDIAVEKRAHPASAGAGHRLRTES